MRAVGEGLFGGVNVPIEPFQQLRAVRCDPIELRIMDMGIDEAGHDQPRQRLGGQVAEARREIGIGPARHDDSAFHHQQPVGLMPHRVGMRSGIAPDRQNLAAKRDGGHAGRN